MECKKSLSDAIIEDQAPILERAKEFEENPGMVKDIIREGCEEASRIAKDTLEEVREAMGLPHKER